MKLFEITFYSIDDGCMMAETSWIVEANDINEVMARCNELNERFKGGIFSSRAIPSMKLSELSDEKIIEEFEML